MKRRETGILGERLAREFLKERNYHIVETNYRCPAGEIDIVAQDEDCLVFIEVRTKRSLEFGRPEESITPTKQERMKATAWHYQQSHQDLPSSWRIDVIAVELDKKGEPSRIELIPHAASED